MSSVTDAIGQTVSVRKDLSSGAVAGSAAVHLGRLGKRLDSVERIAISDVTFEVVRPRLAQAIADGRKKDSCAAAIGTLERDSKRTRAATYYEVHYNPRVDPNNFHVYGHPVVGAKHAVWMGGALFACGLRVASEDLKPFVGIPPESSVTP